MKEQEKGYRDERNYFNGINFLGRGLILADFVVLGVIRENKSQWKLEKGLIRETEFKKMSKDPFLCVYWHQRSANNAYFAYLTNKDA